MKTDFLENICIHVHVPKSGLNVNPFLHQIVIALIGKQIGWFVVLGNLVF